MKTNVWLVGMAIFIVLSLSAAAQDQPATQDFQPGQRAAELKERLKLTEDQVAQMKPILQDQVEALRLAIEEYREQGMAGRQTLKTEVQKFIAEIKTKIMPLLTTEQQTELQTFYEELHEQANEQIQERNLNGLIERLKLTEEQIKHIAPILKENAEKRRELVEQFQEQGREALKAFREEHQKMEQETAQLLQDLLNSEQLQEFQALQEELKEKIHQRIFERRQQK